jgi:hypothetical protein
LHSISEYPWRCSDCSTRLAICPNHGFAMSERSSATVCDRRVRSERATRFGR